MRHPFDTPLADESLFPSFRPFKTEGLMTGEEFYKHLNKTNLPLWIMTYTQSSKAPLSANVQKLLMEKSTVSPPYFKADETRILAGIHTKLFIQHGEYSSTVWVGSMNLVNPSWENLMLRAPGELGGKLVKYFEHFWRYARPIKASR